MARLAQIIVPAAKPTGVNASLAATTAASAVTLGKGVVFVIGSTQALSITFGPGGAVAATPSATVGMLLPPNVLQQIDLDNNDTFQVFNTGAAAAQWGYQVIKPV